MQYLGGKSRLAKSIAFAILVDAPTRDRYIEPMVGGGSVLAQMAPHFKHPMAGDVMPDLILMWKALQDGWVPPCEISEEDYRALPTSVPSPLRGLVGFGVSFGGRWFEGMARGAGRNFMDEASRGVRKKAATMTGVKFKLRPYGEWKVNPGDVVYLDPPYVNTKPYSGTEAFDHATFWTKAEEWAKLGAHVYVSEFTAPEGWSPIWEKERGVGLGGYNVSRGIAPILEGVRSDRLFKLATA